MRRVGVLGGTFDPVHHGHLAAASEVAHRLSLDEVVFVPAGQPWQKPRPDLSPAEDRYLMTVAATAADPRLRVSRVDVDRDGPSSAAGIDAELYFITGADALAGLPTWHRADELAALARFVGVTRPGHALVDPAAVDAVLVDIPSLDISSTDLRARVRSGAPIRYLVPAAVEAYVVEHGLYGSRGAAS